MAMKNPPHPGRSVRENCLDPLGLRVTEAAEVLGVARHTLSRLLNGHAGISPDMAIRLEKAGWSSADFWLSRQTAYGPGSSAQGRRQNTGRALPATAQCVGFARDVRPFLYGFALLVYVAIGAVAALPALTISLEVRER